MILICLVSHPLPLPGFSIILWFIAVLVEFGALVSLSMQTLIRPTHRPRSTPGLSALVQQLLGYSL